MYHHHPPTSSSIKPVQTTSRRAAGEIPWNQTTSKWRSWGNVNDDDIANIEEKNKHNNLGNKIGKSGLDSPSNLKNSFENLDLVTRDSIHDDSKTKINSQSTAQSEKTNDTVTVSSDIFPTSSHLSVSSPMKENSTLDLSISPTLRDIIISRESNQVSEELTDEEKELRRQAIAKEQQQRILQQVEEMRRRKQRGVKSQGPPILNSQKSDSTLPSSVSVHKSIRDKGDHLEHDEELRKYQRERIPRTKGLLYQRFPGGKLIQVDRNGEPLAELHRLEQSNDLEAEDQDYDDDEAYMEKPSMVSKEITLEKQEVKVKSTSLSVRNVPNMKKVKSSDSKLKNKDSKHMSQKVDQNPTALAKVTELPKKAKRV